MVSIIVYAQYATSTIKKYHDEGSTQSLTIARGRVADLKMRRIEFESHENYLQAQLGTTRYKMRTGRANFSSTEGAMQAVAEYVKDQGIEVQNGICHGVRTGDEMEILQSLLAGDWLGTEIYAPLCKGGVVCWDFTQEREEWKYQFDVLYSNSLDHARDPIQTLKVWKDQVKPGGVQVLEWHGYHNKLNSRATADCFAASLEEYRDMLLDLNGNVEVLVVQDPPERKPKRLTRHLLMSRVS